MNRQARGRAPSAPELIALWTRDPAPWRHFFSDEEWFALLDNERLIASLERDGFVPAPRNPRDLGYPIEVQRAYWDRVLIEARKRAARKL